jgi:hypothetical protein
MKILLNIRYAKFSTVHYRYILSLNNMSWIYSYRRKFLIKTDQTFYLKVKRRIIYNIKNEIECDIREVEVGLHSFLSLGSGWRWVVDVTPLSLYPDYKKWVASEPVSAFGKETNLCSLSEFVPLIIQTAA